MKYLTLILILFLSGCHKSVYEEKQYLNTDFIDAENRHEGFNQKNDFFLEAFFCKRPENKVLYSAAVYMSYKDVDEFYQKKLWYWYEKENRSYAIYMIDKPLYEYSNAFLHENFNMWAEVTVQPYFDRGPLVDNPCFDHVIDRVMGIYYCKAGDTQWQLLEVTKNKNRITEIITEENNKIIEYLIEKEKKERPKYIQQWRGSYSFGYGFRGSDDNYEMAFKIDSTSATIFNKKNNQETQRQASIVRATNDSLELRDKNNAQYILYKQNGGPRYAITGEATYLLNPPNDHYPLMKDQ